MISSIEKLNYETATGLGVSDINVTSVEHDDSEQTPLLKQRIYWKKKFITYYII